MDPNAIKEELRLFQSTLLQDGLKELLNENKFVDCTLKVGDRSFPCHRLIMAACSPYFRDIFFTEDGKEVENTKEVVLEEVNPSILDMVIQYLYSAEIDLTDDNVQDIIAVANRFQIPSVFTVCVNYLLKKLSLGNCLAIFRMGLVISCPRLAVAARNYVADRFELLYNEDEFLKLAAHELFAVIGGDSLNVAKEELTPTKKEGEEGAGVEGEEEESPFPGFLNDNRRQGMYGREFIVMINDTASVAYDVNENECFLAAMSEQVPRNHVSLASQKNQLYVIGGVFVDEEKKIYPSNLDPLISEWVALPPMPSPRCLFNIGESDNLLFAVAGKDLQSNESLDSVMCFDIEKMKWSETKKLPLKIHGHAVISHKGLVYCIGGKTDDNKALSKVFVYNHKQAEWREMASMTTPRAMFGSVVHNNQILVAGGVNEEGLIASCEAYDFAANKWEPYTEFPQERSSVNLLSNGGSLYAVGGFAMVQNEDKEVAPTEVTDVWQYEEDKKQWSGMLREMRYAAGSSCVSMSLNAARMPKL
ncbi:hypothetical protein F7725_009225 [Dissostichus mawsoni]|uniref:BTB domain-containing protein n=1 Tax=Dissostichus mawsoni TaxID=36200 RepID=A0A7J5Z6T9_DISMA|nr:hypothetical protein F7725_009225 [Dissostichus mawsoni]